MLTRRWTRAALAAAAVVTVAACEDGTGPELDPGLDAEAALEDYETLNTILDAGPWEALRAMGAHARPVEDAAALATLPAGLLDGARGTDARSVTHGLVQAVAQMDGATASVRLISQENLGATFVYDPELDQYVVDPNRDDAPADGVRFDLYEVDSSGNPLVDQRLGHADLIDEGEGTRGVQLRLVVTVNDATVLDYRTALDLAWPESTLSVSGFVVDDGAQLDFDIDVLGRSVGDEALLDLDFRLAVESRGFLIEGTVDGLEDGGSNQGEIDLLIRHGTNEIRLEATGADGILDGRLFLDGELYVTIQGPEEDPTVTPADGGELSTEEILVVLAVADVVEDVFDLLEDVIDPIDALIVIAILL